MNFQTSHTKSNAVLIAQAISGNLEDEFGSVYLTENEDDDSHLKAVGAELSHGTAGTESFEVLASDGQVYRVCVVPIPTERSSEFTEKAQAELFRPVPAC
jgi:hypothetical protein